LPNSRIARDLDLKQYFWKLWKRG